MQGRLKNCALVICLFVFLFVIIGGGLHHGPRPASGTMSAADGALIVAMAVRLYLNATVPSDQYGTAIGTVRSGGSSLLSASQHPTRISQLHS